MTCGQHSSRWAGLRGTHEPARLDFGDPSGQLLQQARDQHRQLRELAGLDAAHPSAGSFEPLQE